MKNSNQGIEKKMVVKSIEKLMVKMLNWEVALTIPAVFINSYINAIKTNIDDKNH